MNKTLTSMKTLDFIARSTALAGTCLALSACQSGAEAQPEQVANVDRAPVIVPGALMDLSHWKITLPTDSNRDGKIDEVEPPQVSRLYDPRFFYTNEIGEVVFAAPNKAVTSIISSNTRSELRQMIDPVNSDTRSPGNNFALASHPRARRYGAVGSWMSATLRVNHVAVEAKNPDRAPAYSVVVGQIHAGKDESRLKSGFGYGNEPLKIYFKKWPHHEHGSVFWTYERNLEKDDPNRTDIAYPVWGNTWESAQDPGENGIKLNEEFSYTIDVDGDMMHLTFKSPNKPRVEYSVNLANNVNPYGEVDPLDNPRGYQGDWFYFKAGAYNQCSTKNQDGMWYAGCGGTGNWALDKAQGHYAQASFSALVLK
ncbi:polysaccharide lyase family 7 protein [Microbulbifer elongatus]|nr:polysaccharide lyase family 7 protein [Microbulbifer elongatus]